MCEAQDAREAHESEAAGDQAASPSAHARFHCADRGVAQDGRARLLQLPRGTWKPRSARRVSRKGDPDVAADAALSQPEAAGQLGNECIVSRPDGYTNRACSIRTLAVASPPVI